MDARHSFLWLNACVQDGMLTQRDFQQTFCHWWLVMCQNLESTLIVRKGVEIMTSLMMFC